MLLSHLHKRFRGLVGRPIETVLKCYYRIWFLHHSLITVKIFTVMKLCSAVENFLKMIFLKFIALSSVKSEKGYLKEDRKVGILEQ